MWKTTGQTVLVGKGELYELRQQRLRALEDAVQRYTGGVLLPVERRQGWAAALRLYGRASDGSLRARIEVTRAGSRQRYIRSITVRLGAISRGSPEIPLRRA